MTKELTPLQALQNIKIKLIRTYDGSVGINGNMMFEKEIPIIEKALKDIDYLKALNEAGNNNIKLLLEENRKMKKEFKAVAVIKKRFKISSSPFEPFLKQVTGMTDEEIEILKEGLGYYDENGIKRD